MHTLLDPTNDYVFKRLFAQAPELLVALINDLRPDLPDIASVHILNPGVEPTELTGKYIVLDVVARDAAGHCYNVEVQVRRFGAWHKRGLFYLARTLGGQLTAGEDYQELRASVGLHLLDFDLFTATAPERQQALWRFEMRDERLPSVSLGNILQMNLIELTKADRLGLPPGPLRAWITFFKHWQEELTMATVAHEPVKQAMNRIRELSADEEARRAQAIRQEESRPEKAPDQEDEAAQALAQGSAGPDGARIGPHGCSPSGDSDRRRRPTMSEPRVRCSSARSMRLTSSSVSSFLLVASQSCITSSAGMRSRLLPGRTIAAVVTMDSRNAPAITEQALFATLRSNESMGPRPTRSSPSALSLGGSAIMPFSPKWPSR